nr:hypothetical protein [Pedobacter glucosidilyticus]
MKKKFIIPMIAVAAISGAVLFSAFKTNSSGIAASELWFQYDGSGSVTDPSNYSSGMETPPGCEGSEQVCAIRAQEGAPGQPDITSALQSQINAALQDPSTEQQDVRLRSVE